MKRRLAHATLDDWIAREAISFSFNSLETSNAIDQMIGLLDDSVELLGFGEALHGGEDILILRNRLFERLVEVHGYRAIAIESSFPRAYLVNEYIASRSHLSYEELQDSGFGHGFGLLEANRELVEWMRRYNADSEHQVKIRFYGFDIPVLNAGLASPRQVLEFVLDYLDANDSKRGQKRRQQINSIIGEDAQWENLEALTDPAKAIGLSPNATALRIETEDIITEIRRRRHELIALSNRERYSEAFQYALVARQLLNYHAAVARKTDHAELLSIRDLFMADNLAYIVARERGRGKVFAFAHNGHLQRSQVKLQMGAEVCTWLPAGAHIDEMFGWRYLGICEQCQP
jgi:erythromycin esterase